jgi:site-specific recombinase XerD
MHVMRHTFASTLVRRGDVNPEQLRKLLGHTDLRITQRYFHLNKKSLRETVKKLEKSAPESALTGAEALRLAKEG